MCYFSRELKDLLALVAARGNQAVYHDLGEAVKQQYVEDRTLPAPIAAVFTGVMIACGMKLLAPDATVLLTHIWTDPHFSCSILHHGVKTLSWWRPDCRQLVIMRRSENKEVQERELRELNSPRDRWSYCLLEHDEDAPPEGQLLVFLLLCARDFSLSRQDVEVIERAVIEVEIHFLKLFVYLSKHMHLE